LRSDWNTYFLGLAFQAATRSTCPRRHVGAVLVRKKRIVSTGYNGAPPGAEHCDDAGCLIVDGHCLRAVHAETNVLLFAGDPSGTTLYLTDRPCLVCANAIATAGVAEVIYARDYGPLRDETHRVFTEAGVRFFGGGDDEGRIAA
jgi:dCMP deaminase